MFLQLIECGQWIMGYDWHDYYHVELTPIRKKILVFWWFYHKKELLWPSNREAAEHIKISQPTLLYHVNLLIEKGWMNKKGHQIGLSHYAYGKLEESENISLGKNKENLTKLENKAKKTIRDIFGYDEEERKD